MHDRRDRRRDVPERPTPQRDPEHDPGRDVDDGGADVTTTATLEPAPLSEPATSRIRRGDAGGLPGDLRGGLESLSGFDLGDVRVHHDSARPATLGAAACTAGADIHLGPGQEEHLAHEAWHVVQQRQGRVAPTARIGGAAVSDDAHLEQEADTMGARALSSPTSDTAPRRRASAGSGAVQLKWGQHDGSERDRVRGVLQAAGRLEPFPYDIAGVLEELVHDHKTVADADLQTAVQHLADHLTSLPRARAITDALAAGTAHAYVDVGCRACADDTKLPALLTCLTALAQVVQQPPDVAVVTIAAALLAQGRTSPQVVDVISTTPTLVTTEARASAVVDHRAQGGTAADAILAASTVGADDAALAAALTAVRVLVQVPGFGDLPAESRKALLGEREHLTTKTLRTEAVAIARGAEPAAVAGALARTRPFGYREDVETHVGGQADEHAKGVVAKEKQRVTTQAASDRVKAVDDQLDAATKGLSSKNKKGLESGTGTSKYKDAATARTKLQQTLAAPDIALVDSAEQSGLKAADDVVGPQAKKEKTEKYTTWLASVGHHPKALDAIKASGEDLDLAKSVLDSCDADARVAPVLLGGTLTAAQLRHVVTVPAATLGALVAGGLTDKQVAAYGASVHHAALLSALGNQQVPVDRIQDLVGSLETFRTEIADGGERAALATLLVDATPAEVATLRKALPQVVTPKLAALVPLLPKAADSADLARLLAFTDKAGWTLPLITTTITAVANDSSGDDLDDAVYDAEARRFVKATQFSSWLYAIDRLVEVNYLRIVPNGTWRRLPGGATPTDEQKYDVLPVARATYNAFFVVHDHPGATGATVGNTGASKNHLKPDQWSDEHYTSPALLKSIRPKIQMSKP